MNVDTLTCECGCGYVDKWDDFHECENCSATIHDSCWDWDHELCESCASDIIEPPLDGF